MIKPSSQFDIVTIESLEDFKKFLISINHENEYFLSRGVSDEAYKFTSSVRYEFPDNLSLEQIRDGMKTETDDMLLKIENNGLSYLENLSNLQHEKRGTYLSDYSFDPYVGLYFACKIQHDKHGKIVFIPSSDGKVFYTTPEDVKNGSFDHFVFNDSKINDNETIRLLKPRRVNNKLLYQSSIFAIDRGDLDVRVGKIAKYVVRIPDKKKRRIFDDLRKERKSFRIFDAEFDGNNIRNVYQKSDSSNLKDIVTLSLLVNENIQDVDLICSELIGLFKKSNDEVTQSEIINFSEKFNCQIHPLLIAYYMDEVQYAKAMNVFNNIKLSNMDLMTTYSCAILWEKISDYKNSIMYYENCIRICEDSRTAKNPYSDELLSACYFSLAGISHEMGRNQEAIKYVDTSIQYHDTVEGRIFRGEVNKRMGVFDIAISNFNEAKSMMLAAMAMRDENYSAHPYHNIAACLIEEGKYLNVIAECYEFLWARSDGEDVYYMLFISCDRLNGDVFHELSQHFKENWYECKGLIIKEPCEEDFNDNLGFHSTIEEREILISLSDFVLETKNLYPESVNNDNLFNEKSSDYEEIKNSFSYFGLGAILLIKSFDLVAIFADEELSSKQQKVEFAMLDVETLKRSIENLEEACKIQPENWVCVMNLEYAKLLLAHQSNGVLNENSIKITISKYNSSINQKRREIFHKTWINRLDK